MSDCSSPPTLTFMQSSQHSVREFYAPDLPPVMANLAHRCLLLCLCKGLPKAATINHHRLWYGTGLALGSGIKAHDVIYTTMPLYHSAALMIGLHGCIVIGTFNFSAGISSWHTRPLKGKNKSSYFPTHQREYLLPHWLQGLWLTCHEKAPKIIPIPQALIVRYI